MVEPITSIRRLSHMFVSYADKETRTHPFVGPSPIHYRDGSEGHRVAKDAWLGDSVDGSIGF